jgi:cysteine synthase A
MIGSTPLLAIRFEFRGRLRTIYAKAEHLNLTGSIKDRIALYILQQAHYRGELRPGDTVVEATSGNTGISFAAIARALGHPVAIFMPDWMSDERKRLMWSFGAELHLVSRAQGGFLGCIRRAEELAAGGGAYLPRQFRNADNAEAHRRTTGPEIAWQLENHGIRPDAVVAGVGTGGTVMGVGGFLRSRYPWLQVHPLEPANSPTLSVGHKVGQHRIQGISDDFVPPIVDLASLDRIVSIDDGDAIRMAQKLARELGLAVGISSGANFLGAVRIQDELDPDAIVVTVFSDDNKKYLSTDLVRDEPSKPDHLAPHVHLVGFHAYRRACKSCVGA